MTTRKAPLGTTKHVHSVNSGHYLAGHWGCLLVISQKRFVVVKYVRTHLLSCVSDSHRPILIRLIRGTYRMMYCTEYSDGPGASRVATVIGRAQKPTKTNLLCWQAT